MFSIIIRTYNGARTLDKVIKKILNQQNYDKYVEQFIIVDNASTDNTKEIVLKNNIDNNIIYSYESKSGLSYARLNGVNLATAEWTIFVDDDNELDSDWIDTAARYIEDNPEVAIFGGSVIPKLEFEADAAELDRLKKYHGMLACTNMSRDEIDFSACKSPFGGIIGAGMVVKTHYLKELAESGWIKHTGRAKDDTAVGDDGDISRYIIDKKKEHSGFCPNLIIEHNLPKNRIQEEYLIRLKKNMSEGAYYNHSVKSFYILRRMKAFVKIIFSRNPYPQNSFDYKMRKISDGVYIRLLVKDKLFFRKGCGR